MKQGARVSGGVIEMKIAPKINNKINGLQALNPAV
jgi:hypothetical protein